MKFLTISILLFFISINVQAQSPNDIIGKYHMSNGLDLEIFVQNGKYFGKIIKLNNYDNGQKKDVNNPDETKRNDNLLGKVIIKNLEFDKNDKQWKNGSIYSPEKGMVLDFKVKAYRKNEIEVEGSKYLFWKTLIWKRI